MLAIHSTTCVNNIRRRFPVYEDMAQNIRWMPDALLHSGELALLQPITGGGGFRNLSPSYLEPKATDPHQPCAQVLTPVRPENALISGSGRRRRPQAPVAQAPMLSAWSTWSSTCSMCVFTFVARSSKLVCGDSSPAYCTECSMHTEKRAVPVFIVLLGPWRQQAKQAAFMLLSFK